MDPITHAVIGLGTAALSGQPIAFTNPIYIGAVLGAIAPDIDVATHPNPLSFLRHHRGVSHSLPGIAVISFLIASCLTLVFPQANFLACWGWTFLGAFSHSILDSFNSYGTQLWWPFMKEKWTVNLLVLYDPYLLLLYFMLLFSLPGPGSASRLVLVLVGLYLYGRYRMRQHLTGHLKRTLGLSHQDKVVVMPAQFGFARWEFVIDKQKEFILGKINYYGLTISEKVKLVKEHNSFTERALASSMGRFFRCFTPHLHLEYRLEDGKHVVFFRDLRFMRSQKRFLHTATVIINDELKVIGSCLHAFRQESIYPVEGNLLPLAAESLHRD